MHSGLYVGATCATIHSCNVTSAGGGVGGGCGGALVVAHRNVFKSKNDTRES